METFIGDRAFYLVWCLDTQTVTKQHVSYSSAQKEARRLSRKFTGKRYFVMKSLMHFHEMPSLDTPITLRELQRLPPELIAQLSKQARAALSANANGEASR